MPIEAVLFDADDTLWDFQVAARRVTRQVLSQAAVEYPALGAIHEDDVLAIRRELGRRCGQSDVVELRRLTFARALATAGIDAPGLAVALTEAFLDGMTRDLPLFHDTVATLETLAARYALGVVSNGTKGPEAGGIQDFFRATALGPIEGIPKPDPRIFRLALERMGGIPAGAALMVGDHEVYDVAGARAAGLRAVLVDRTGTVAGSAADAVVRSLSELPQVLGELG